MKLNGKKFTGSIRTGIDCLNYYSHSVDMILIDTKKTDDEKFSDLLKVYEHWINDVEIKKNLTDGFIRYMTDLLIRYLSVWSQLTSDAQFNFVMSKLAGQEK